jgi:hypothetical protein
MPKRNSLTIAFGLLSVLMLLVNIATAQGQQSSDRLWTVLSDQEVAFYNFRGFVQGASAFRVLKLDPSLLKEALAKVPKEFKQEGAPNKSLLTIPTPTHAFITFRLENSPAAESQLEFGHSLMMTYRGFGIEDTTATGRFDFAVDGFHAMVRSSEGTFFIDPQTIEGQPSTHQLYFSYFADRGAPPTSEPEQSNNKFNCTVKAQGNARPVATLEQSHKAIIEDKYLRTYRIAVAADSDYVDAVFDQSDRLETKLEQALRSIARTINRVNEIYESELGIHLDLVKDEAKLIFVDPSKDPFRAVNADPDGALATAQKVIDNIIGDKNYDIGHLFATQTAGKAQLRSVCQSGTKAEGVTGIPRPTSDAFDVNYVAHEIGHQFGANHTFNGTLGFCGQGNRNPETAFEPGSGSTIMSYTGPGLCAEESVQSDSDRYFHAVNLTEIARYVLDETAAGGGSCARKQQTPTLGIPDINAGPDFIIPKGTPFVLQPPPSSGPASKLAWEQYDLGAPGPPDDEAPPNPVVRPLFRSRKPTLSGIRYLPAIENLLEPSGPGIFTAEAFPEIASTLTFRLTARNGFGRFNYQDVHVHIDSSVGPFKVKSLVGGSGWAVGTKREVKWEVARSNQPSVQCSNVTISVFIDGDTTNEKILTQSVPNSGSAVVTMPEDAQVTSNAILKIQCVGNIFFAIAPTRLQILPGSKKR